MKICIAQEFRINRVFQEIFRIEKVVDNGSLDFSEFPENLSQLGQNYPCYIDRYMIICVQCAAYVELYTKNYRRRTICDELGRDETNALCEIWQPRDIMAAA